MPTAAIRGRSFSPPFAKSSGKSSGDRQALRYSKGLCGLAQAMDRRTHHRLAQPLPPLGQGLGVPQPKGLGVLAPGLNPPHAAKALSKNIMIPDRLLEGDSPYVSITQSRSACQCAIADVMPGLFRAPSNMFI